MLKFQNAIQIRKECFNCDFENLDLFQFFKKMFTSSKSKDFLEKGNSFKSCLDLKMRSKFIKKFQLYEIKIFQKKLIHSSKTRDFLERTCSSKFRTGNAI